MAKIDWDLWDGEGADGHDYCQSIYELAKHFQPKKGLEIGVRFGKSALATLKGSPEMRLIGIDPNPEYPVVEFMAKHTNRFAFINEASPEALDRFGGKPTFDWVYIDGRHDYHGVREDFAATWPLLVKGGVMLFDDYDDTLGYGTEVKQVLEDYTLAITGKPFEYITMSDYGLHPSPHADAILIKE